MTERRSIYVDCFTHSNPIPAACQIGNLIVTGAIAGTDPVTGTLPDSVEQQCANIFHHMREIIREAGGGIEHIIKVTVWHDGVFREPGSRAVLNAEWIKMFPSADKRPARQSIQSELGAGHHVMADMMAVLNKHPAP